ncbi:MAG: M20/M25/M40 family metallo-hydrolase [Defluviitaleaceae bacterium]|nr:M20/M25/M40 family metallo-hydrolase [Defluviitaleaceae bacterium]MCL2836859.1 M20/M25/M40 family metallo-hydrolase [Defluviitaleaceae bacterium]
MGYGKDKLAERIREVLYEYVALQTDTGTAAECEIVKFYDKWFSENAYFNVNPDLRGVYAIPGDSFGRSVCWALIKGGNPDTILLLHHSDTVDTDDYLTLKHLANKPDELEAAFKQGKMQLDSDTAKDLNSGEWIFGRGVNDMKGGAAVHIALFEEYAKNPGFTGSLLLLAVPDEENLSAGMIGAAPLLNELKRRHGLNFILCLNTEPSGTQTIIDGSVGKIMPMIYARGKLAHAADVFGGLNPIRMMADVVDKLDVNPVFADSEKTTTTSAPTFLYLKDRKNVYDVSLPIACCGYMTLNCMNKDPLDLMRTVKELCAEAFAETIRKVQGSCDEYNKIAGRVPTKLPWQPKVIFYSELYDEALRDSGAGFENAVNGAKLRLQQEVAEGAKNLVQAAQELIELTLAYVKDQSPVIIAALAPPFYPNVNNGLFDGAHTMDQAVSALSDFSVKTMGYEVKTRYMTGMSDLSYVMHTTPDDTVRYIEQNMLMWGCGYHIPFDEIKGFSMPVLNIGPEGKDLHMYTERVNKQSLFYDVPAFLDFIIRFMLRN